MTDSELIALLNKRDESALTAVSERFGGLCRSLASNILSDRRDVEECLSSVYFKLWSSIPPAEPKDLTAYVARTARNEALMRLRKNSTAGRGGGVCVPLEELEYCLGEGSRADDELQAMALAKATEEFIRRLPALQRNVFMRRYWFFDSAKAISERFGIKESRVYSLLAKTRRELRRYLIKEEYIDE